MKTNEGNGNGGGVPQGGGYAGGQQPRRIAVPVRTLASNYASPQQASAGTGGGGGGTTRISSSRLTPGGPGGGGGGCGAMNGSGEMMRSSPAGGGGAYPSLYTPSGVSTRRSQFAQSQLMNPTAAVMMSDSIGSPMADYGYRVKAFPRSAVEKSRGLRHFSNKVCEKVKEKGQTNYNEVADELVVEYFDSLPDPPSNSEKQQYEMKNIRRRVYDALNVLMAMNIIEKEKKEIRWVGLPTSSLAECRRLEEERAQRQERLRAKSEQLQELIIQLVAYKSLVQRNRQRERDHGRPADSAVLYLPYIIVNTDKEANVECRISSDKTEYCFTFDRAFEIHDDIEVLKRLGLAYGLDRGGEGAVSEADVAHVKSCLPPALRDYVDQIISGALTGGVLNRTGLGPHTVSITTNLQQKSKFGGPQPIASGGGAIRASPRVTTGAPQPLPSTLQHSPQVPVARYTVIPRTVSASQARYGNTMAHYRVVGGQPPVGVGSRSPYTVQQPQRGGRPMMAVYHQQQSTNTMQSIHQSQQQLRLPPGTVYQGGHPSAIYHQQGGVGHHSMNMGQQQHVEVDVVEGEEEYLEEEEIYDVEGVIDEDENIDFE